MDNFNKFTYVDILKSCIPIGRDKVLLINRLSNGMKKCEQGEELLGKGAFTIKAPRGHHWASACSQCSLNNGGVA